MITITEKAAQEIKKKAAETGREPVMRAGIRGGGCTGYTYFFDFAEGALSERDQVFEAHGVTLWVDNKSLQLLDGSELDFSRSLMGYGFKWNNPNVKSTCGCGESVSF
jgi:iron-sulfur cluster assembly protein